LRFLALGRRGLRKLSHERELIGSGNDSAVFPLVYNLISRIEAFPALFYITPIDYASENTIITPIEKSIGMSCSHAW
jgi:hypothetical protein